MKKKTKKVKVKESFQPTRVLEQYIGNGEIKLHHSKGEGTFMSFEELGDSEGMIYTGEIDRNDMLRLKAFAVAALKEMGLK